MSRSPEIGIKVNGRPASVPEGGTVLDVLRGLDLHPGLVVVERNGEILDRELYRSTALAEDDRLELVHFVGGG